MTRTLKYLCPILVPLVAACGPAGGNDAQPVNGATAQAAGNAMSASVEDGMRAYDPIDTSMAMTATCHSIAGDTSDDDQDGIPTDVTITYTHCSEAADQGTVTVNGTQSITDDNTSAASFEFTAGVDLTSEYSAANATATFIQKGTFQASEPAGAFQVDTNASHSMDASANGETVQAAETVDWTTVYTPGSPWSPGQPVVAGTYSVDGTWSVHINHNGHTGFANSTVATLSPLQIDPACESRVVGGSISATYEVPEGTASLTVTWTGCGQSDSAYSQTPNS